MSTTLQKTGTSTKTHCPGCGVEKTWHNTSMKDDIFQHWCKRCHSIRMYKLKADRAERTWLEEHLDRLLWKVDIIEKELEKRDEKINADICS